MGWIKSSPLETYLNTVAPVNADDEASAQTEPQAKTPKSMDKDWEEGARAVILTILNNVPVLSGSELQERSEFDHALFTRMLDHLARDGLVETRGEGYQLTDSGKLAARRERDRLLGML